MIKIFIRIIATSLLFILLLYAGLRIAPQHGEIASSADIDEQTTKEQVAANSLVQFTLDSVTFRMPLDRLRTRLRRDKNIPNEIRYGFAMLLSGPVLPEASLEKSESSSIDGEGNQLIPVEIERYCSSAPNPEVALQDRCNLSGGMQADYDAHGWSKGPRQNEWYFAPGTGPSPPQRILQISGMEYQGYSINHPDSDEIRAAELIYKGTTQNGHIQFAVCEIASSSDDHSCQINVPWRDRFDMNFTISEAVLPQWQAVHRAILDTVESYVVTPDTPMVTRDINLIIFPPTP